MSTATRVVTLTIDDDAEDPSIQTFVQTVHLPLTANAPAQSSIVAYEDRAVGNGRLWVVNQDNQTVSVFDAITNSKITEITVGDALYAITLGAAHQMKMDHLIGSIEAGKFADFAVLEEDPLEIDPMRLKDIEVWGTVLGGEPLRSTAN